MNPPIVMLVVENNPGDICLLNEAISRTGADVQTYAVGEGLEAMEFVDRRGDYANAPRPDVIVLDLNLPRRSGREILADLATRPALKGVPVAILTSSQTDRNLCASYTQGRCEYFVKAGGFPKLVETVRQIEELARSASPRPQKERPLEVLLIEDSESDAILLREALADIAPRAAVTVAGTLAAGLTAARRGPCDLLLLDLNLPDSTGVDTLRQATEALPELPIIVLTGLQDEQAGIDALRAGAQDYLVKGRVEGELLGRSIRYALERHAIHRSLREARDRLEDTVRRRTAELEQALVELRGQIARRIAEEHRRRLAEAQVLEAAEREQRRIGRDLHDTIQGNLAGLMMMLEAIRGGLDRGDGDGPADLERAAGVVKQTIQQVRGLSRSLCPVDLQGDGLTAALYSMAETTTSLFRISCRFHCDQPVVVPDEAVASHLYHIAREAVNNALKHAKAKQITVRLGQEDGQLALTVEDDGVGMPPARDGQEGMGLRTMAYRASVMGGTLAFLPRDGGGTVVKCLLTPQGAAENGQAAGE